MNRDHQTTNGILRQMGGRLAPPTAAQRSWRLALVALLLLPQTVVPATITVDDTPCTLVDAITSANTDAGVGGCTPGDPGLDTLDLMVPVALTASDNYTYFGYNGLPVISTEITIEGNGNTIERTGGPDFRLFAISPIGTLTLNDATVSGGYADFYGGGIFNYGTATLTNSTVSGNSASRRGGGIYNSYYGTTTLTNSTVSGNTSGYYGGGIFNSDDGTTTLTNSTVSGNYADFGGGGISNDRYGTTTLTNSTVSGNYADFGGGLYNEFGGTTTLTNSTVSGNYADFGGGIYNFGTTYAYNSLLSANTAGSGGPGCFGGYYPVDGGNNFSENGGCGAGFAPITSGIDIDPVLADNGGPTLTHALLDGSVAIDAAGVCGLATDQRGEPRDDGACDSGSFELQQTVATCEQTLRDLADYILALPLSDFVGSSAARRSILASRAIGAANSISFCAESSALIRLQSLIRLVDGIGRDYMVSTPNDVTSMAQDLYDTIDAGECPECAP